ncbi:ABC transporter substrate-binding protein [Halomicrobium urmianum]|uniref:ABC transporter substrate-binding protein n=1 Tax=Halomicrobium urmianum TaxID=1586233 RepID=UPI001CD922E6|nr:ABC transporter substrate-binding protein [Halomicrobium urmianum]
MSSDRSIERRNFLKATGSAAAAAALAGCSGDGGDDGTGGNQTGGTETGSGDVSTELKQEGDLWRVLSGTITTLDPIEATDTSSGILIQQMFDPLMNYPDGLPTVEALQAADYSVSDDFLTYEFQLEDATFHNGDDVTASDFAYAFERLAASENSSRAYFILDSMGVTHETTTETVDGEEEEVYEPGTLGVEAVDDSTLRIELSEPFHATLEMLAYTAFSPIPEGTLGDVEGYDGEMEQDEFSSSNPIGNGPFEFDDWESGTEARVAAFGDYYGEGPNVDGVHWAVIEDDTARYNYLMNRNADVAENFPTAQYDPSKVSVEEEDDQGRQIGTYGEVRNGATMNYSGVADIGVYYLGFNMDRVEKPIRQAVAYALNQHTIVEQIFKQRGEPAYNFTPPSIFPGGAENYRSRAENEYPYGYEQSQMDQARSVMEEAGYGDGERASVELTIYESEVWSETASILRDQLQSAYVDLEVNQAPLNTLLERGRNGELQMYSLGWVADWPAPDNFLQLLNPPQTDTSMDFPVAYLNWNSETGDAAEQAAQAYQTVLDNSAPTDEDGSARDEAYVQIENANWEDVAMLPVYHQLSEVFWYDHVDVTPFGGMGPSRQMMNTVSVGERE